MHRSNVSIGSLDVLIRCAYHSGQTLDPWDGRRFDIVEMGSTTWGITPLHDKVMLFD